MNKINGRTPEEIKNGLEYCISESVLSCDECPYAGKPCDSMQMLKDSLTLIQQLEAERDQYKRERDAAVEDMTEMMQLAQFCRHCKHLTEDGECTFDFAANKGEMWCWQWRGPEVE